MSRVRSRWIVSILACALAAPAAAQPRTTDVDAYLALLDRYARGDYDGASQAMLDIDVRTADPVLSHALAAIESKIPGASSGPSRGMPTTQGELDRLRRQRVRLLRLALLVHTEAGIRASEPAAVGHQLALSRKVVAEIRRLQDDFRVNGPLSRYDELYGGIRAERQVPAPETRARLGLAEWDALKLFLREWYLVVASQLQRGADPTAIDRHLRDGLELFKKDPELLLARGTHSEDQAHVSIVDRSLAGELYVSDYIQERRLLLVSSRDDYDAALAGLPELHEATLRRGRTSAHLGDRKSARSAYEAVAASSAPAALQYLAWLFLGQLAEDERQPGRALGAYEHAHTLMPNAQTAMVGLSRLCDAASDAICARRWLDRAFSVTRQGRGDPWWDYQRGQAWMAAARLASFRARGLQECRGC